MAINPLKNYKLLLVDADIELARVVKHMLGDLGFTNCNVVHQGSDAYRLLKNEPYDFLITESSTGQMSGTDLLRKIRLASDSPNPVLPVILMSGRAEQPDVIHARDSGVNEFVVKPFSAKSMVERLHRLIEHPRQFVISEHFVGPTRRARVKPPAAR